MAASSPSTQETVSPAMLANDLLVPANWSWFSRFNLDRSIAGNLSKYFSGIYLLDFPREVVKNEGVITCPMRSSYLDPLLCYLFNLLCFQRKFLVLLKPNEIKSLGLSKVGGFSCDVNDEGKVTQSSLYLNSIINEMQNFNLNLFCQGFQPNFDMECNYNFKHEFLDFKPKSRLLKIWIHPLYWKIVPSFNSGKMILFGTYGKRIEFRDYLENRSSFKENMIKAKGIVEDALKNFYKKTVNWNCLAGSPTPY